MINGVLNNEMEPVRPPDTIICIHVIGVMHIFLNEEATSLLVRIFGIGEMKLILWSWKKNYKDLNEGKNHHLILNESSTIHVKMLRKSEVKVVFSISISAFLGLGG